MTEIERIASGDAREMALAFRNGTASPVDIAECLLDRIGAAKGDNIFITTTIDRAMSEARRSEARHKAGQPLSALDGVPIAWKDNIDIAGAPTTAGSLLFKNAAPKSTDASCAANVAAAGMVCMGKLNMSEFAYSGLGLNPHFGTPRNPRDKAAHRSPGGSSSGSGAAVAALLVPIAIGTDTGGSIRVPASYNGVVGFKTSTGRIAKHGLFPLSRTLDTIGPLARSVADCALVDMALRGAINVEARRIDLRSLTIVTPSNVVMDDVDAAVSRNFERSLEALAKAGATIRRMRFDALDEIIELTSRHGTLIAAEAYNEHRAIIDSDDVGKIDRRVVRRIVGGKTMSANDVLAIQRGRQRLIPKVREQLADGLLAMPTTPLTAPAVEPLAASEELFFQVNPRTLRNAVLGSMLDQCGLALPNGHDANGLPTSILFSASHGDDVRLLSYGLEIERHIQDCVNGAVTPGVGPFAVRVPG